MRARFLWIDEGRLAAFVAASRIAGSRDLEKKPYLKDLIAKVP